MKEKRLLMSFNARIELQLAAAQLESKSLLTDACSMVVVYMAADAGAKGSDLQEVGRTEVILNHNDPTFKQTINVNYFFEKKQYLQLHIYSMTRSDNSVRLDDPTVRKVGVGEVQVGVYLCMC